MLAQLALRSIILRIIGEKQSFINVEYNIMSMETDRLKKSDVLDFLKTKRGKIFTVNEIYIALIRVYPFKQLYYKLVEKHLDQLLEEGLIKKEKKGYATLVWMEGSNE